MSLPILSPNLKLGLFYFMKIHNHNRYLFLFLSLFYTSWVYSSIADTSLQIGSRYSFEKSLTYQPNSSILFSYKDFYLPKFSYAPSPSIDSIKVPKTSISFITGAKKENFVGVDHFQTIKKMYDLHFNYTRAFHNGFYSNQNSTHNALFLKNRVRLFEDRFMLYVQYFQNKSVLEQNGGIINDSIVLSNSSVIKENVPNQLSSALYSFQNKQFISGFQYDIWQKKDSLETISKIYLNYNYIIAQTQTSYQDITPNFNFYQVTDSAIMNNYPVIFDSLSFLSNINRVNLGFKNKMIDILTGVSSEDIRLRYLNKLNSNNQVLSSFNTLNSSGHLFVKYQSNRLYVSNTSDYIFSGFSQKNFLIHSKLGYLFDHYTLEVGYERSIKNQNFQFYQFSSSLFEYENALLPTAKNQFFVTIQKNKYANLAIRHESIKNFAYFNPSSEPVQHTGVIPYLAISSNFLVPYKTIGLKGSVTYQQSPREDVLPLPNLLTNAQFFYKDTLFKGTLLSEFGLNAFYFSKYYAPKFMSLHQQFYIQQEQKIGNYPILGVYACFYIKTFNITLAYSHVNQKFMTGDYRANPGYFQQDANFRISIRWDLYN